MQIFAFIVKQLLAIFIKTLIILATKKQDCSCFVFAFKNFCPTTSGRLIHLKLP